MQGGARRFDFLCVLAMRPGAIAAFRADLDFHEFCRRLDKPALRFKHAEHFKQNRRGGLDAGQIRAAFAVGVPDPDADRILRRHAERPGVAVAVTRAGFPRNPRRRFKRFPADFHAGARDFLHGLERQPTSRRVKRIPPRRWSAFGVRKICRREKCRFSGHAGCRIVQRPRHARVHAGQLPQRAFRAAENQRQAVLMRRASQRRHAKLFQQHGKPVNAVRAEQAHRRNVERAR